MDIYIMPPNIARPPAPAPAYACANIHNNEYLLTIAPSAKLIKVLLLKT